MCIQEKIMDLSVPSSNFQISFQKCHPFIAITVINNKLNILIGDKYFHSRFNNWSMRNLGNVQRNHMIKNIRKKGEKFCNVFQGLGASHTIGQVVHICHVSILLESIFGYYSGVFFTPGNKTIDICFHFVS